MKWLPPPLNFPTRLAAIHETANVVKRLDELSNLANANLSFLEIMQVDRVLSKTAHTNLSEYEDLRLAVLSSSTLDHALPPIRVAGLRRGLRIEIWASGFGQYRQELLEPTSELHLFRPHVVLLSLLAKDFIGAVPLTASPEQANVAVESTVQDLRSLWKRAQHELGATVIQQSFLMFDAPLFGALDSVIPGAPTRLVARLNAAVSECAYEEGVVWLDVVRASARDGLDVWFDSARWLQAKMEIAPQAAATYGELVARLIAAARGKSKKCLVLDLDNTLWGGVIGDDGVEGIVLGHGSAVGEAHLALQHYAKALRDRGIILAVCSKNDAAIAEAAFRDHPEMLLKYSDFAAFVANWNDKPTNLKVIAKQLNIGLDSLVFVDDNPTERAHVRSSLPMVAVPELPPDVAHYTRCLADAGYFEAVSFTAEDQLRAGQYSASKHRESLRAMADGIDGIDGFLKKLEMSVDYGPVSPLNMARVTQLINKTNQFNTTTLRLTEAEVAKLAHNPEAILLQFRLLDKFGDNGIVSVILATPEAKDMSVLNIANWVMSCRVFGRQLEYEALNILVEAARHRGLRILRASYTPTAKNTVIQDLFLKLGFSRDASLDGPRHASSDWSLMLDNYVPRQTWIARKGQAHDR